MKQILSVAVMMIVIGLHAEPITQEVQVRKAVQSFYDAFNSHGFDDAEIHHGRLEPSQPVWRADAGARRCTQELKEVHGTFLKGVTDMMEEMDVRFATRVVAVVTVTSQMSTFITPDKVRHENERHIRTFVVLKQSGKWLIMQDQNTLIAS